MRRTALIGAVFAALLAAGPAGAEAPAGWAGAVDARRDLASAQSALALGELERSRSLVARAAATLTPIVPALPAGTQRDVTAGLAAATVAGANAPALARARATLWTALLRAGLAGAVADATAGDAAAARTWLLVREYRAPTRFTRAGTDATLALTALDRRQTTPRAAAHAVRADLLDTYEAKLRTALDGAVAAAGRGYGARLAERTALARGYAAIVAPSYRSQRGTAALARLDIALASLERAAARGTAASVDRAAKATQAQLEGFRAAPLPPDEQARRAGQLDRFLRLVPIEYDRGVEGSSRHCPVRDPRGDLVPGRRRVLARGHRTDAARQRRRCDARADREPRVARPRPRRDRVGPRRRSRRARLREGGALARADRRPLPAGLEGCRVRRRLRRDRGLAQPARERGQGG